VPNNFVLLERIELNNTAASVTFANIPQSGYTDLKVVISARSDRTSAPVDNCFIGFNGAYTSLTSRLLYGDGASAASLSNQPFNAGIISAASQTANTGSGGGGNTGGGAGGQTGGNGGSGIVIIRYAMV